MENFLDTVSQTDPMLLQQVRNDCDKLLQLKFQMEMAEENFKKAQKAYVDFATKQLPEKFKANGIDILGCGNVNIRITTKTRASILKGKDDGATSKANIAKWLRERGYDEYIKEQLIVPQSQLDACKAAGISFQEDMDINTNKLKALVIDLLGQNGSPALINKDEIPEGLSFYQWDEAEAC